MSIKLSKLACDIPSISIPFRLRVEKFFKERNFNELNFLIRYLFRRSDSVYIG